MAPLFAVMKEKEDRSTLAAEERSTGTGCKTLVTDILGHIRDLNESIARKSGYRLFREGDATTNCSIVHGMNDARCRILFLRFPWLR